MLHFSKWQICLGDMHAFHASFYVCMTHLSRFMPQLAQGYTFVEHFGRTYHQAFIHKCRDCNGAGTITCPECRGYKHKPDV